MSSERGVSLLDALVATAICVVGVVTALQVVERSMASTRAARDRTVATQLADEKVAELTAVPFDGLVETPADAWARSSGDAFEYLSRDGEVVSTESTSSSARYIRRWAITTGTAGGSDWRAIDVSVAVIQRGAIADAGLADGVRLTTIRARAWP